MNEIDIIIPTFNLPGYLLPCLQSIVENGDIEHLNRIIVINNGTPESLLQLPFHPKIQMYQQQDNLGWEGGLKMGLMVSETPFVVFMNDDTFIPKQSRNWLSDMLKHFDDPQVAGVGPSSNVVMGMQHMSAFYPKDVIEAPFIVGFCAMLRREALDKAGGVDDSLPNHGDDIDFSIRLRKQGYKMLIDRSVFVFHYGFKTGERVEGEYWNSVEMQDKTNHSLIRKHGLREVLYSFISPSYRGYERGF
jgi:GT2 family glycosyltransferase